MMMMIIVMSVTCFCQNRKLHVSFCLCVCVCLPAVNEFEERWSKAKLALNEQGLNAALYWDNPDVRKYINVVPTSAITGEGMADLLFLVIQLTQKMLIER